MAIKSGSCKASLMFANETRSGLRDREDNGQLLPGGIAAGGCGTAVEVVGTVKIEAVRTVKSGPDQGPGAVRARADPAELREQRTRGRTATLHLTRGRVGTQPLGRNGRAGDPPELSFRLR